MLLSAMQRPHSFGLVASEVGVLCSSKVKETADNISADGRKRLNDISVTDDGTCRQERAPVLDRHLHLNKGSSVFAGKPRVTDRIVLDLTHESSVPLVSNTLKYTYFILTQLVPRLAGLLHNNISVEDTIDKDRRPIDTLRDTSPKYD